VCDFLTDVPGVSAQFLEGIVAYSNRCKVELLGVEPGQIETHGAVSAVVAGQMAAGARRRCGADVGVSTTGIAGPTGGSAEKPVGLVFIGVADRQAVRTRRLRLRGDRETVKDRAAKYALDELRLFLAGVCRPDSEEGTNRYGS
jgi:nicotinamide-nucleotide amidase